MATNAKPPVRPPELSQEAILKLVEQQSKETDVRMAEIDLRSQELKYNSAHAEKILGAQERDRNAEREFELEKERAKLIFAIACIALVSIIIIFGMYMDKDALVADIVKIFSGAVLGMIGGYGYARVSLGANRNAE